MRLKNFNWLLIACLLVFSFLPGNTLAKDITKGKVETGEFSTKDEVIYGKLTSHGQLKNMYVVNAFNVTKPGEFIDYGYYTYLRNLTDLSRLEKNNNNEIHFTAEDDFYYQGELENMDLPWEITIDYLLDGQKISPDQLAGQNGKLDIQITTKANEQIDPVFFDYYLLQITMKLDPLIFSNIHAPKGTEAKEGKNTILSFNIMPGQAEEIIVTTDVKNLSMEPIEITAIPANLAIEGPDTDDLAGDMQKLADAIHEIHDAVGAFTDGTRQLSNGVDSLHVGSNAFYKGMSTLNQSSTELVDGSGEILNVFKQIEQALDAVPELPNIDDLATLPKELKDIAKDIKDVAKSFDDLNDTIASIPNNTITAKQIDDLYKALDNADKQTIEVVQQLVATYEAAQEVKDAVAGTPRELSRLLEEIANNFLIVADELETALNNMDDFEGLTDLTDGLTELTTGYTTFHNGLVSYTEGVNELTTSYKQLNSGTNELAKGASDLSFGANKLYEGTNELQKETSQLPEEMQSEIDRFIDEFDYSGFEATSFVSDKNEKVGVVQFVLQTEEIKLIEDEMIVVEDEEKSSFWSRVKGLFK